MTALEIVTCGPLTTIQDCGRIGLSRIGLPAAGAMDQRALRIANALVGNPAGEAAIELAFAGLIGRAIGGDIEMAVAGALADITCETRKEVTHQSFVLRDGETLRIGPLITGAFAVVAIAGGIAVPPMLGSRSLDLRAGIGGLDGRALRPGDRLPLNGSRVPFLSRWSAAVPLDRDAPIRIVLGPQDDAFTERGLQTLIDRPYVVSNAVSRMAYRLDGPPIERRSGVEILSDGTLPGSIQVPPDGQPIVLMADRQTIGGYPKIGTVISADLGRLAQRRPGEEVRFAMVSAREAREIAAQVKLSEVEIQFGKYPAKSARAEQPMFDAARIGNVADAVVDASDSATWEIPQRPLWMLTSGTR